MKLKQRIQFCKSQDGVQIALATIGKGPPIVRAAHWLSHIEYDLKSPVWQPWLNELSRFNTYVRYDQRSCGLSDWTVGANSLDAWVSDLEAVVDKLGLKRFPLIGMSQGGAIAMAYAAKHPDKVSKLVLLGAYGRGARRRSRDPKSILEADTLVNLVRLGWGANNPAFSQVFTNLFIPDGKREQHQWWTDLQRVSASPENAANILEAFNDIDITDIASSLTLPTLVFHAKNDARVPFEEGRRLASLISDSKFVPLESNNHVLLEGEPAWTIFLEELRDFLEIDLSVTLDAGSLLDLLTPSERDVMHLLLAGKDNRSIAGELGKSEKTVRNQVSSILSKLDVKSRSEAISLFQ